ncbi:MAG: tetratricopeptide repeat protein [Acidobacteriia bacterium]|nr:tetratricopeptide repeat protein [Terriglobia bacterium]
MAISEVQGYEFGPYRIDTDERLLHRNGDLVALPPKVVGTLLVLVGNAGRMVDKGDLMKAVWPDTFVEEGALTRNISLLRKTLGDTEDQAVYIETIPKRGYRFVAPVRAVTVDSHHTVAIDSGTAEQVEAAVARPSLNAATKWLTLAVALVLAVLGVAAYLIRVRPVHSVVSVKAPESVLAVLPFRSFKSDNSQDYFAEGITQALITDISKLGNLRVISLASDASGQRGAAALNSVVREQSVNRVLTGTVLRSGGRVRIDAQLIDPKTRAVHWANYYERDIVDLLTLESAVAEAIAGEIQVTVTAEERQRLQQNRKINPTALDKYLRGRYFWNRRTEEGLRGAAQYFEQSIAADPTYAAAYTGLADSYSLLGSIGVDGMPPNKAMPLAKAAAQKALELDPRLAEAHVSLAYVKLSYDWDLHGAEQEFSQALSLNPSSATAHHWYSHYLMAAGDLGKATEQMQEALRLEPLSPSINIGVGWCLYYSKQYDKAIEQYRAVAEMEPSLPLAHQTLGMAYQQKGMYAEAIEEFQRAASFSGNNPASVAALASAYGAWGKPVEARRELARLEEMSRHRYVPAFYFASIHFALGNTGKTFEWGWKAIGERCDYLMYLRVEPRVGTLASHPEFIRAMGHLHP